MALKKINTSGFVPWNMFSHVVLDTFVHLNSQLNRDVKPLVVCTNFKRSCQAHICCTAVWLPIWLNLLCAAESKIDLTRGLGGAERRPASWMVADMRSAAADGTQTSSKAALIGSSSNTRQTCPVESASKWHILYLLISLLAYWSDTVPQNIMGYRVTLCCQTYYIAHVIVVLVYQKLIHRTIWKLMWLMVPLSVLALSLHLHAQVNLL